MSMQDRVADMLTRIRNAQAMGIKQVRLPYSNFNKEILQVLQDEGYITSFDTISFDNKKDLLVTLKYYQGRPVIEKVSRVSRPGLRVYRGYDQLPTVCGGLGMSIVSTPKGVMSDKKARAQQVGGEIICNVV